MSTAVVAALAVCLPLAQEPPAVAAGAAVAAAKAIRPQVEQICGATFDHEVALAVLDAQQMQRFAQHKVDVELADGRLERLEAWLHVLALIGPEQHYRDEVTKLLTNQAAGVYDPERRELKLAADTSENGVWYARYTIAHELAHALDDQLLDLDRLMHPGGKDPTKDQLFALGAATEGSAIAVSDAWAVLEPPGPDDDPMATPAARAAAAKSNAALLAAPPYVTLLLGRHLIGRMFFAAGRKLRETPDGAYLGLLTIAGDLPASTEQVLHPDKYWDPARRDAPIALANEDELAAMIEERTDLHVLDRNTLGELVVALLAQPIGRKLKLASAAQLDTWTNPASIGWGGDRLFVVGRGGGTAGKPVQEPGVVWLTAWDSEDDRVQFAAALQQQRGEHPGFDCAQRRRIAVFAFGSARAFDAASLQQLLAASRFRRGAESWAP